MYPPTPVAVRWTGDKSQTLTHNGITYVIPPKFVTALNFIGLHYNPKYWGEDATEFRPERWENIGPAGGVTTDAEGTFPSSLIITRTDGLHSRRDTDTLPRRQGTR